MKPQYRLRSAALYCAGLVWSETSADFSRAKFLIAFSRTEGLGMERVVRRSVEDMRVFVVSVGDLLLKLFLFGGHCKYMDFLLGGEVLI